MKIKTKKGMKKEVKISLIALGTLAVISVIVLLIVYVPRSSNNDSVIGNQTPANNVSVGKNAVLYEEKYSFYNFTDPNENAFAMKIPGGWQVFPNSGLMRPYIDAGVMLQAASDKQQGFFYISPYRIYTVPNNLLDFAGFTEGKYYDPSNGLATPMLVKKYTEARDFLNEYIQQLNVNAQVLEIVDRPDLINQNPISLVTKQSAAEMTYTANGLKYKLIAYIYLIEYSGTGIWAATLFGYYSPESLFNETEYLVLQSEKSFKVNPNWAAKEAKEANKRAGIISSTQDSISESISSSFEYKSESMDRINDEWSKTILGVEEVYNPETGDTRYVDSGAKYYWMDNKNNIYGTETDESPFPLEDMTKLEINKEI
jgi:hypothetical protein